MRHAGDAHWLRGRPSLQFGLRRRLLAILHDLREHLFESLGILCAAQGVQPCLRSHEVVRDPGDLPELPLWTAFSSLGTVCTSEYFSGPFHD